MSQRIDEAELERHVKDAYGDVAEDPDTADHIESGRLLAERVGYPSDLLDRLPAAALESFTGVGYHFDLADLREGDDVLDLGSGSGSDAFIASFQVGESGSVCGLDMSEELLEKARRLRDEAGFTNVKFEKGKIEDLSFDDASFDVVISNGVINLSPDKNRVLKEAVRVLRPGGRLAISDLCCDESEMPESIKSDPNLWAACVGGSCRSDLYTDELAASGMSDIAIRENPDYDFASDQARNACEQYGIRSVSFRATKES